MNPVIGLVMIVKDEEAVIERALRSAKPWISRYVIVDTGSTDKTKEIIRAVMSDISGLLIDRPWVNFEVNRTEALEACRGQMDWAIMLDADDNLAGDVPGPAVWQGLGDKVDGVAMSIRHGDIHHQRLQVFRVAADWCYRGVLHESPHCRGRPADATRIGILPASTYMVTRCEGVRSRDPEKYFKDAMLLESEWARRPDDKRTLYYLAQSWRDSGNKKKAAQYYREYVDSSGGWAQERYMSYVNLIEMTANHDEKVELAWKALEIAPNRLEAQYSVLKSRRLAGLPATQQVYALSAVTHNRKVTADIIYVNPAVYTWGFDDEFAVVAFATGHYREAYEASVRAALGAPAPEMRENALRNATASQARL